MDVAEVVRKPQYLVLLLVGLLVGMPAAALSLAFLALVSKATDLVWTDLPQHYGWSDPPGWFLLLIPAVGGLLAALLSRLPGNGGHSAAQGLGIKVTPWQHLGSILGAAFVSLTSGAVLGPEAPIIALGGVVGGLVLVARSGKQSDQAKLILTVAGVSGAMSALFGNPLAAAVFVLEALPLAGAQALAVMLPSLVAAAGGWVLFTGLGSWTGINAPTLTLGTLPAAGTPRLVDYVGVVVVAAVAGGVATLAKRVALGIETSTVAVPRLPLGIAAGLVVGGCAWLFATTSGESATQVLFSGQRMLPSLAAGGAAVGAGTLALLVLFKGVAYAVSMGSPLRGGPIFAALFIGGLVGTLASALVPSLTPLPLFAAGLAAAAAAMMRLPLSAAVLVTVLFGQAATANLSSILIATVVGVVVGGLLTPPGAGPAGSEATAAGAPATP